MAEENTTTNTDESGLTDQQIADGLADLIAPHPQAWTPDPGSPTQRYYTTVACPAPPAFFGIATPTEVLRAREDMEQAAEAVNDVVERLLALPGEQQAEDQQYVQAVQRAEMSGAAMPRRPRGRDYGTERLQLDAQHAWRHQRYLALRTEYEAAIKAALPHWSEAVAAQIQPARQAAEAALASDTTATVHEAVAAFATWRQTIASAEQALRMVRPRLPHPRRRADSPDPAALAHGVSQARAALHHDDPALSGEYLEPDDAVPSRYERRLMWESGDIMNLAALEREENYSVTDYSEDFAKQAFGGVPPHRRGGLDGI